MTHRLSTPAFDGIVCLIRGFVDGGICQKLTAWAQAVRLEQFVPGITRDEYGNIHRVTTRVTNRMSECVHYPDLVYELQGRIRNDFRLGAAVLIPGHGRDGVVVSIIDHSGDVYAHRDPAVTPGFSALRCNILASQAESGGLIHVGDRTYELAAGDLMAYLVTDHTHSVDVCLGRVPRIMFMFGFQVRPEDWAAARYVPGVSGRSSGHRSVTDHESSVTKQSYESEEGIYTEGVSS